MADKDAKRVASGPKKTKVRTDSAARSGEKQERRRAAENPNHREDFDRLLEGMARSSEEPGRT